MKKALWIIILAIAAQSIGTYATTHTYDAVGNLLSSETIVTDDMVTKLLLIPESLVVEKEGKLALGVKEKNGKGET